MRNEWLIECASCRARIDRDTIRDFLYDVVDYLGNELLEFTFTYLNDGSVGIIVAENSVVLVNYLTNENKIKIYIYHRRLFDLPELDDRMNLYFIPGSINYNYKG